MKPDWIDQNFNVDWSEIQYPSDVIYIMELAYKERNAIIGPFMIKDMWEEHSDSWCAGWLCLPDDESILRVFDSWTDKQELYVEEQCDD